MRLSELIVEGGNILDAADDKFDASERRSYMNASEALGCIRKQWYSKHQPDQGEPQSWGFARRGRGVEEHVVRCLIAAGVDLRLAGKLQEGVYSDDHMISATPDGVQVTNDSLIGTEFKSIDPRTNRSTLPKKEHVAQLQIGMALMSLARESLGLPDLPFSHGVIVYTDASNWDDSIEFTVPFKPSILDDLKPRAQKILGSKTPGRLPREGKTNGYECKYCAFRQVCNVDSTVETTDTTRGNRGSRLETCLSDYIDAKVRKDQADGDLKVASERIKQELIKRGTSSIDIAGRHIELTSVAGRKSLDRKAVQEAGIDLTPYETVGAPSERLTVK
jgi:hypothetical protein